MEEPRVFITQELLYFLPFYSMPALHSCHGMRLTTDRTSVYSRKNEASSDSASGKITVRTLPSQTSRIGTVEIAGPSKVIR